VFVDDDGFHDEPPENEEMSDRVYTYIASRYVGRRRTGLGRVRCPGITIALFKEQGGGAKGRRKSARFRRRCYKGQKGKAWRAKARRDCEGKSGSKLPHSKRKSIIDRGKGWP
jgi:hypothetical protein